MIVLDLFLAFLSGAAANQLDRPLGRIQSHGWELIARYISGVLSAFAPFMLLIRHIKHVEHRGELEAALAFCGAFSFTAIGVLVARGLKELTEDAK